MSARFRHVVALSGGVGGARLVHGLYRALPEGALSVVVNTGDDLVHWGLYVTPDLDTVMYTLAELSHDERGWGLADETFSALAMLKGYGEDSWFQIGDRDLGTHLSRTLGLNRGESLSAVTARLSAALGITAHLVPMADAPVRTVLDTAEHGSLPFQEWLVRKGGVAPTAVRFQGTRTPSPQCLSALASADLVVIGPSNPYVSIDPILAMDGVREALAGRPIIAVSPIVAGHAIKGPLPGMIRSLAGREPSAAAVAEHYRGLLTGFVVETGDGAAVQGTRVLETSTVMRTRDDRVALAREVLRFAERVLP